MQTEYFWIALAAILLLLDLWAMNSVLRSDKSSGTKAGWTALIFLLPLLGVVIWAWPGRAVSLKGHLHPNTAKDDRYLQVILG